MIGAIAGDIIGSPYEHAPIKTRKFPLFQPASRYTDDSVLTVAVAAAILTGRPYLATIRELGRRHPHAGYGGFFRAWLLADDSRPYGSWGNGSAMRASPIGHAFASEEEVLEQARLSAAITHDHPEGIKGAQAAALGVFLARTGHDRAAIRTRLGELFGYDLSRGVDQIRPTYAFDISCQGTLPAAIASFVAADSFEDAVRNAVSLGGDSDTLACIAGALAAAHHGGVPPTVRREVQARLAPDLWEIVEAFERAYPG